MSSDKDTVIHSGFLTRRCGPKKQKIWQERFFTLCQSNKTRAYYLCYYRTPDYTKQQRDVTQCYLPLASPSDSSLITTLYRFDRGMYQRPGYVFALHPGASSISRRTYLFEAKTLAERDKWIQSLLAHGCQDGGVIMPALQDANALHESWLWVKQSGVLHGWKWRLVALRWNEIRYYKLHDGKFQLNGQVMLSERSLLKPDSSKKHSFTFQSNSSAKPLHFSCHDDHERAAWITAIQRVCESTSKPLTERHREYITSCFMDTPVSIQRVHTDRAHDAYLPVTIPTTTSTVDFGYPPMSASTATTNTDSPSTPTSSRSSRPSMSTSSRIEESQSSIAHPSAIYSTQMLDAVMIERERELAERESRSRESSVTSDLGSPITSPTVSPRVNTDMSSPTSRERHTSQTPHIMSAKTAQLLSTLTPIQLSRTTAYQSRSGPHPLPTTRRVEPIVANSRPQLTPAVRLLPNPFEINQIAATPEHRERVISRMPSERLRTGTTSSTSSPPSSSPSHSYSRFTMSSPSSSPPGSTRGFTMSNLHSPTQVKPTHERSQTEMITSS